MKLSLEGVIESLRMICSCLETIFPEIAGKDDLELFKFFYGIETTVSKVNDVVVYEDKVIKLLPRFKDLQIAYLPLY